MLSISNLHACMRTANMISTFKNKFIKNLDNTLNTSATYPPLLRSTNKMKRVEEKCALLLCVLIQSVCLIGYSLSVPVSTYTQEKHVHIDAHAHMKTHQINNAQHANNIRQKTKESYFSFNFSASYSSIVIRLQLHSSHIHAAM